MKMRVHKVYTQRFTLKTQCQQEVANRLMKCSSSPNLHIIKVHENQSQHNVNHTNISTANVHVLQLVDLYKFKYVSSTELQYIKI